ncbi:MAG TPA: DUF488 domain-containing protein [Ferrovibrio sp.]|jgi:uncharacterized protein (DUF488 family)|uniref:DUF488 domain-containing protein n=1 Tax=Ferrovibrio sp. TaxID=1917215 RepID=UPI002ECFD902
MALTLFTIGHSNHAIAAFIALLQRHGIAQLADVRSTPASRFAPQFNRSALAAALGQRQIAYRWFGERLGGRSRDAAVHDAQRQVDHTKLATSPEFRHGINELIDHAMAAPTAIMCAERDPQRCHRTHLVTPALISRGVEVRHILADGTLLPHAALQRNAMPQLDLFGAAF